MADSPAFLADRLRAEGEKTLTFFQSLSPDQWDSTVYTENATWSVRDVFSHFVAAENGFLKLFRDILAGGSGAIEKFDIDRFNASQHDKMRTIPAAELMTMFQTVRAEMATMVDGLSEADLQKQGRHPFLGLVSLEDMIKMVYRHNQIHHRDLRKVTARL